MPLAATIETLRELNEQVLRPFRLPTEAEVLAAERTLGVAFPSDYRYFLLHGSDITYGTVEPAVIVTDCGHLNLQEVVQTARQAGVPKDLLPFCENNGDYYCFTPDGRIAYWAHNGLSSENWPDLSSWIQQVWIEGR